MMTPKELLQSKLDILKKAKEYSKRDFKQGKIDLQSHTTHIENLEPKIS